ncbi:unnamed protein product [Camellia sinensis]
MLLPSAPMYSLKSFEFVGAAWISEEVAMRTWKMHKQTRSFDEAMLIGCRVSVSTRFLHAPRLNLRWAEVVGVPEGTE